MQQTLTRRAFTKTMLAGAGAAALPSFLTAAETPKLKIGCTTLIWGGLPRTPENLEPALKDTAALGFHGFGGHSLEDWEKKGTLASLLQKYPIPLTSGHTTVNDGSGRAQGADRNGHALCAPREELTAAVWCSRNNRDRTTTRRAQGEHHRGAQ
jgi:hypothetical protein